MMFLSSVIFVVLPILHVYGDELYRCPSAFKSNRGAKRIFKEKCYLFVNTEVKGDDAIKRCHAMGAQPVEILDSSTQDFLTRTIRSMSGWKNKNGIWIGFTDNSAWTHSSGIWTWLASGTRVDKGHGYPNGYMNWVEGEPSDGILSIEDFTDDCAILSRENNYKWSDRNCKAWSFHYYICQFHMGPRTTTTTTTTTTTMPPTTPVKTTRSTKPTTPDTTPDLVPTAKVHIGDSKTRKPAIQSTRKTPDSVALHAAKAASVKDSEGQSGSGGASSGEDGSSTAVGLGIGIGLGVLVVLIVVIFVFVCRRKRRKQSEEEPSVTFHNEQYTDQQDAHVYTDIVGGQYTEMTGGAEGGAAAAPNGVYRNCSLPNGDSTSNKKNELAEMRRSENLYEVPSVSEYAVPNTPPPTYYPPGLPPPYAEAGAGATVESTATDNAAPVTATNDTYDPSAVSHLSHVSSGSSESEKPSPLMVACSADNEAQIEHHTGEDRAEAHSPLLVANPLYERGLDVDDS